MKYNLKDIGKRIYKGGEIEYCGRKSLLSFVVPIIELLVYKRTCHYNWNMQPYSEYRRGSHE